MITYSALLAECKLCPDLISIKVILKNGVIRTGHMSYGPEEELREKFDRSMEVIRKKEKLRLFLSLDSIQNLNSLSIGANTIYIDIPYKDIAKIERLEKIDSNE